MRRNRLFDGVILAWGRSTVTVERAAEGAKELAVLKIAASSPVHQRAQQSKPAEAEV